MKPYPKIETVFKRDKKTFKVIEGDWRREEFEYLRNNTWEFTEKVDGTNIRIMWDGKEIKFGGKTDNAQIPIFLLEDALLRFKDDVMECIFREIFGEKQVCLYGEGYGARIQKGGGNYISDHVDFILFDVKIDDWWLERPHIVVIAKELRIDVVPVLDYENIDLAIQRTKEGFKSHWGDFLAEGMVLRPLVGLKTRRGDRVITKIKHKDF